MSASQFQMHLALHGPICPHDDLAVAPPSGTPPGCINRLVPAEPEVSLRSTFGYLL